MTPEQAEDLARIERSLTNHTPSAERIDLIEDVRGLGKELAAEIIGAATPSRERSLALTHLEETVMWAVKAIILQGLEEG